MSKELVMLELESNCIYNHLPIRKFATVTHSKKSAIREHSVRVKHIETEARLLLLHDMTVYKTHIDTSK